MRTPAFLKFALVDMLAFAFFNGVDGFVSPKSFAGRMIARRSFALVVDVDKTHINSLTTTAMLPDDLSGLTSVVLSDEFDRIAGGNSSLEGLRTFFVVITALVFGFAGLTYVFAAVIVPQAAEQLERDTRRLRPELMEEYEAKLEDGETLATRPDLLQELGNVMQPIITADFEKSAQSKSSEKEKESKD
mmetsp:Transcript_42305/g.83065  ORF Transcript_42305/g.83065 Transcript_42305/m.83065 type:complete len:189 (+) Transcript_42305:187-753(+)|eukprot:CAMPEP_0194313230 /NCGR_PEP_ID=MMETSP0171-20130528/10122_1 /TAXON_ID=218684 /ORGANISM="Corethron pennatum, Strain L29A3" /LENGTH=188 /DNA_ID=CAMNT_0039068093 /DNA_START=146 /DNA_END=712 /DNA_ORIENTATION=+